MGERARRDIALPDGRSLALSAGGQNVLIAQIVERFCLVFTPGGTVVYIGDADEKWAAVFERDYLASLGVCARPPRQDARPGRPHAGPGLAG